MTESKTDKLIREAQDLLPRGFYENTSPMKMKAYLELVLADINVFPPQTTYTLETVPTHIESLVKFGATLFAQLFWQMKASLQDFSYSDQGLTVTVDQVGKVGQSYINMLNMYRQMVVNHKKTVIISTGGKALTTPRYQSQLGQFLKISLGSAFTWNSP